MLIVACTSLLLGPESDAVAIQLKHHTAVIGSGDPA
jgi:hypothetical protein